MEEHYIVIDMSDQPIPPGIMRVEIVRVVVGENNVIKVIMRYLGE